MSENKTFLNNLIRFTIFYSGKCHHRFSSKYVFLGRNSMHTFSIELQIEFTRNAGRGIQVIKNTQNNWVARRRSGGCDDAKSLLSNTCGSRYYVNGTITRMFCVITLRVWWSKEQCNVIIIIIFLVTAELLTRILKRYRNINGKGSRAEQSQDKSRLWVGRGI